MLLSRTCVSGLEFPLPLDRHNHLLENYLAHNTISFIPLPWACDILDYSLSCAWVWPIK
uniref:Uncharacterized protein n=1 Tax=Rhinolophus ferrumequinum TaxID=59479 RepID=A0A671EN74_RHIFE